MVSKFSIPQCRRTWKNDSGVGGLDNSSYQELKFLQTSGFRKVISSTELCLNTCLEVGKILLAVFEESSPNLEESLELGFPHFLETWISFQNRALSVFL